MSGNKMSCPASLTLHSDDKTCHSDIGMTPHSDDKTCHSDIGMTPYSDNKTCHSDIGMTPHSDDKTCHSDIGMTPHSDNKTCHSDIGMTPHSDDKTCHSDIGMTPHSDDKTCHSDIGLTPHSDDKTCHSDIGMTAHSDDKTCHSDIGMTPHSDDKTCHSDIEIDPDSSGADSDDTIVDGRFSEEHLQTASSGVTHPNTVTEIVKKFHREIKDCSNTVWFSCSVCRFFFPNSKTLEEHNKMHHNHELPHICRVCATRFRSMYSLMDHCEKMHKNSTIMCLPCVCLLCKQRFSDPYEAFRKHLLCHFSDIEVQTCSICYKTEPNTSDMEKHILGHLESTHTDGFLGHFQLCDLQTNYKGVFIKHQWTKWCNFCTFHSNCKYVFETHQSSHEIGLLRTCEICGKQSRELKRHMLVHSDRRDFRCSECGASVKTRRNLELHMAGHTGEDLTACAICHKVVRKKILPCHMAMHSDRRDFCCNECGSCYNLQSCGKQSRNLKQHMEVHSDRRDFCCNVCGALFKSKRMLSGHMTGHTGEDLTACAICHKRFRKTVMPVHMRTHTNERPFKCDLCDATFRQQFTLDNHKRTHNDERPFSCSVCDKRFTQRQAVSRHMLTHTGEKPYQCAVCQMRFTQKSGLKGHIRRHDKNTSDNGELGSTSVNTGSDNDP